MGTWRLVLGFALIIAACLVLIGALDHTLAKTEALFFAINPDTGILTQVPPDDQSSTPRARLLSELGDWQSAALIGLGFGLVLALSGLRQRERATGLPLRRIALPLLAPITAFMAAAGLLHGVGNSLLWSLLERIVPERVVTVGHCMRGLSGCSTILGYSLLRGVLVAVVALAAVLLVPAGRAAWRAGEQGHRLPRWASVAAILCFMLGALLFVGSQGARLDARASLDGCEASGVATVHVRNAPTNISPVSIQAPTLTHDLHAWDQLNRVWEFDLGRYDLGIDGVLRAGHERLDDDVFMARLIERVEDLDNVAEPDDPQIRWLELYVDERVDLAHFAALLRIAAAAGVTDIVLLGDARIPGALPSLGTWEWRVYQPWAQLDLRASGERERCMFASYTALSAAGHTAGPGALAIAECVDRLANEPSLGLIHRTRIVDLQGRAIAGARVVASHCNRDETRQTTTDADGRFSLTLGRSEELSVDVEGFLDVPVPRERGTYVLVPESLIDGQVVDAEGRPVAGARVKIAQHLQFEPIDIPGDDAVVTDAEGRFRLSRVTPGEHTLSVASDTGDYGEARVTTRLAETTEVEVRLTQTLVPIRLRVVDERGAPVPGCSIEVAREVTPEVAQPDEDTYWLETDTRGLAERLVLGPRGGPPFMLTELACPNKLARAQTRATHIPVGATGSSIPVLEVSRGRAIQGRLVDAQGRPISGAELDFKPDNDALLDLWDFMTSEAEIETDANGQFEFIGLEPGPYAIRAWLGAGPTCDTYHELSVEVGRARTTQVTMTVTCGENPRQLEPITAAPAPLPVPVPVRVRVRDRQHQPVAGALVVLADSPGLGPKEFWMPYPGSIAVTDALGVARFDQTCRTQDCTAVAVMPGRVASERFEHQDWTEYDIELP